MTFTVQLQDRDVPIVGDVVYSGPVPGIILSDYKAALVVEWGSTGRKSVIQKCDLVLLPQGPPVWIGHEPPPAERYWDLPAGSLKLEAGSS